MARRWQRVTLGLGLLATLTLTGCTGVGVGSAPDSGSAEYQVWGLNEGSSELSGSDGNVVLNGDLDNGAEAFFTAGGEWSDGTFTLDESSSQAVRELAGALTERTGDPECTRLVLVHDGFFGDKAIAVISAPEVAAAGPVTATPID